MKKVKITYIGGGSQQWALRLMSDLALSDKLTGSLVLYDIDHGGCLEKPGNQFADFRQARSAQQV